MLGTLSHLVITIVGSLISFLLLGDLWVGALALSFFYIGREIAQAEYRWIENYGKGKRANLPIYGFLDRRVWDVKSLLDWLLPVTYFVITIFI